MPGTTGLSLFLSMHVFLRKDEVSWTVKLISPQPKICAGVLSIRSKFSLCKIEIAKKSLEGYVYICIYIQIKKKQRKAKNLQWLWVSKCQSFKVLYTKVALSILKKNVVDCENKKNWPYFRVHLKIYRKEFQKCKITIHLAK